MKTAQEVFDIVVTHARKQGCKAEAKLRGCSYLTEDGKKCFVGTLIPSKIYSDKFEGKTIGRLLRKEGWTELKNALRIEDLSRNAAEAFYRQLQLIHDQYQVEDWEEQFERFAREFNLVVPPK